MKYAKEEPVKRLLGIRELMEKQGIDILIVYGIQWKPEYLHYVSNIKLLGIDGCVVLPLKEDPILYLSEPWDIGRAREESWIDQIHYASTDVITEACTTAVKLGGKIGIAGFDLLSENQLEIVKKFLEEPDQLINKSELLNQAAMVKSEWEVSILRNCAILADHGFQAELNVLREGISEYEITAEIEHSMRSRGADDNFQMIAVGKELTGMNIPREVVCQKGDLVLTEITPLIGCITYATQLCRTVKIGPATSLEKEKYDMLIEALDESLKVIKPGVPASEVAKIQNKIIGDAGYADYCCPPYMRARGHNFGLGYIDLSDDNTMLFKSNMVFVVHPNQYIPEIGYLACGETVLVNESGIERLNKMPAKLYEA